MALPLPDETVLFERSKCIEIFSRRALTYSAVKRYPFVYDDHEWFQVIVEHKGQAIGVDGMRQILDCIFEAVEDEEFFPIGYRNGSQEDRFLVRQCKAAIDKLFARGLKLQLTNGVFIGLKVQLFVAQFIAGHIVPLDCIKREIMFRFENLKNVNSASRVLNLSSFAKSFPPYELVVYLGNRAVLKAICDEIFRNAKRFPTLSGIKLSDNGITGITPLNIFNGFRLSLLDLRNNKLSSIQLLCSGLKGLRVDNLLLSGNPVTRSAEYPDALQPFFRTIKAIDNVLMCWLCTDYTPEIDVDFIGYRIEFTNKADLAKFKHSYLFWHALVIPDFPCQFNKRNIADIILSNLASNDGIKYLCYYKFRNGEHQFLVRDSFEALEYFVEQKNLELDCPELTDPADDDDHVQPVNSTVRIYLRMNVAPFQMGHIEPESAFQKLLDKRFNDSSQTLNLNNFNCTKGMNIIFNTKSAEVINGLLSVAARRFTTLIRELLLSNNKISSCDFTQTAQHMKNLQSVDLSYNLIERLSDIKQLQLIGLRSLNLNGNPICSEYKSEIEYIRVLTARFPLLSVLDTVNIVQRKNQCYTIKKNYLSDHDDYDLVEHFVSNYFDVFESKSNRHKIKAIYHPYAMLAMTFDYVDSTLTRKNRKRTNCYKLHACSRGGRTVERPAHNLHIGWQAVLDVLISLPNVKFDIVNFRTDTISLIDDLKVITVSGVFKDIGETANDPDLLMAFTRTFYIKYYHAGLGVLKCADVIQVTNEHFSIYMPSQSQVLHSFKYIEPNQDEANERVLTKFEKRCVIAMLHEVTNLKVVWCANILRTSNWNFKRALELFTAKCQQEEIPDAAFESNSEM